MSRHWGLAAMNMVYWGWATPLLRAVTAQPATTMDLVVLGLEPTQVTSAKVHTILLHTISDPDRSQKKGLSNPCYQAIWSTRPL